MSDLTIRSTAALSILRGPVAPALLDAISFATALQPRSKYLGHDAGWVPDATEWRDAMLPIFERAVDAERSIAVARALDPEHRATRREALQLVAAFMAAMQFSGTDEASLDGFVAAVIDGAAVAAATELWQPVSISPAILAMAALDLMCTRERFKPLPAELYAACCRAAGKLAEAHERCRKVIAQCRDADAVLLQFARDEWARPYQQTEFKRAYQLMIEAHVAKERRDDDFEAALSRELPDW